MEKPDNHIVDCDKGWKEFKCNGCNEEGRVLCYDCDGEGKISMSDNKYIPCETCNSSGTLPCEECSGMGYC